MLSECWKYTGRIKNLCFLHLKIDIQCNCATHGVSLTLLCIGCSSSPRTASAPKPCHPLSRVVLPSPRCFPCHTIACNPGLLATRFSRCHLLSWPHRSKASRAKLRPSMDASLWAPRWFYVTIMAVTGHQTVRNRPHPWRRVVFLFYPSCARGNANDKRKGSLGGGYGVNVIKLQ